MQIVLKVHHNSNRAKIPYIVDTDYKKRGCYTRNLNYPKFEEKILETIKKVCQIYANKTMLEETYEKINNKTIDLLSSVKNGIAALDTKIAEYNRKLEQLYEDKLNRVLPEADFIRISQKYIHGREELETKKNELTDRFQSLQGQKFIKNNKDTDKMNELISEFLQMKKIEKSYLYRLINKIEIDKDKNVFISFNFAPLNTINENMDEFIELEELLKNNKTLINNVG